MIPYNTIAYLLGPYRIDNMEASATGVITNKVPTAPYRGAGRPEAVFALERAIELDRNDEQAAELLAKWRKKPRSAAEGGRG